MPQPWTQSIAITVGDPRGIGPEIVAKAVHQCDITGRSRLRVICHKSWFVELATQLRCDISGVVFEDCSKDASIDDPGEAQIAYLERAAALAASKSIAALVTGPINKRRAREAGFEFPGHTEFLAARLSAKRVAMMFVGPTLRVVLATIHVPLAAVSATLSADAIACALDLGIDAMRSDFSISSPKLAVLGLNPHAGEGGLLGREELEVIEPALDAARKRHPSAQIVGPLVPDAAFRERADLFVAMYHDQALIPLKLLDFDRAVNVTLGLPIIRTSPDHGTADDIAGKGIARADSFLAALRLAEQMLGHTQIG